MSKIVFYDKETNEVIDGHSISLFVMDNEVYQDNGDIYESQQKVISFQDYVEHRPDILISFQDFVEHRPDIGWRVE